MKHLWLAALGAMVLAATVAALGSPSLPREGEERIPVAPVEDIAVLLGGG